MKKLLIQRKPVDIPQVFFLLFKNNTRNIYCSSPKVFVRACLLATMIVEGGGVPMATVDVPHILTTTAIS